MARPGISVPLVFRDLLYELELKKTILIRPARPLDLVDDVSCLLPASNAPFFRIHNRRCRNRTELHGLLWSLHLEVEFRVWLESCQRHTYVTL